MEVGPLTPSSGPGGSKGHDLFLLDASLNSVTDLPGFNNLLGQWLGMRSLTDRSV